MAITQSQLPTIRYESKDWSGLTTSNNLGYLFGENPIQVSNFVDTLYKVNLQEDLVSKINQFPVLELDDDREYTWMLMGAEGKNIPVTKVTDLSGNDLTAASTAGQYGESFYMYFGEQLFYQTHVIVGENPDLYHLLVKSEPVQIGSDFRIEVELVTDTPDLYVPYDEVQPGSLWSADYSLSEQTLSKTGSDISFTSPFKMANRISMLRKKHLVPGDMILKGKNEPVQFVWQHVNNGGKSETKKVWTNRVDWEFSKEFRREKSRLLMFGKSNRRADGTYGNLGASGYEIKAGMGLRDQIAPANKFYYSQFNIKTLVDFALGLSVGKLPEDQRRFVIGTGEYGLKMVSQAIEAAASGSNLDINRVQAIQGGNKGSYHKPQFVKYADINGIQFEFVLIPEYDDPIRNKVRHPDGGLVESHRLTIMDFGSQAGNPNVQMVRLTGQGEEFMYIPGLRDPYSVGGKGRTKMGATPVDGYEIHKADWCGIKVHNPMRMGEWIYNIR